MDPWYKIAPVRGKGLGVFAVQPIPSGFTLMRTPIVILKPKDEFDEDHTLYHYVWAYPFTLAGAPSKHSKLSAVAFGDVSIINHSDTPNCSWSFNPKKRLHLLKTDRRIERGEEVSIDYGWPDEVWAGLGGKR